MEQGTIITDFNSDFHYKVESGVIEKEKMLQLTLSQHSINDRVVVLKGREHEAGSLIIGGTSGKYVGKNDAGKETFKVSTMLVWRQDGWNPKAIFAETGKSVSVEQIDRYEARNFDDIFDFKTVTILDEYDGRLETIKIDVGCAQADVTVVEKPTTNCFYDPEAAKAFEELKQEIAKSLKLKEICDWLEKVLRKIFRKK